MRTPGRYARSVGIFHGLGWLVAGGLCLVVGCGGASSSNDPAGSGSEDATSTSTSTSSYTSSSDAHIPNQEEAELLAPLWIDEATLLAASGPELIELVQSIGLARGYAVCRCTSSPTSLAGDIEIWMDCANKQSGTFLVSGPDRARCVNELMPQVPGLEAYLR